MANIANLITKLSGIIASLDDIRDAISQGGGGSSTASGVSVTPTSPLIGTNLQATTNETAALLQEHTDDISALNSRISTTTFSASVDITNYTTYANAFVCPSDGYLQLESGDEVNDYMIAIVSTSNTDIGFIISAKTQVTNYKEYNAVYVRKGMKCYASAKNGSDCKLSFRGFS